LHKFRQAELQKYQLIQAWCSIIVHCSFKIHN